MTMRRLINLKRVEARRIYLTYGVVILAYIICQTMSSTKMLSSSMRGMLVPICAYMVMAVSLNLVVGISGELSLGHAGFMSVGAFSGVASAILMQSVIPFEPVRLALAMIIAAVFAAIAGFLIGIPVLRLKGDYLAIVTLAFGEIIKSILNNFYMGVDSGGVHFSMLTDTTRLLKGGRLIIRGPMGISGIQKISTFPAGFILVMISLMVVFNLVNSRSGRAFMAIRDDRIAAESIGLDITKYKMMAFVTSAALAGAAGALFAMNYSTIVANKFDFNTSILILVFVVLGGQGNMLGGIIAAAVLTILPEKLRQFSDYRMLLYAIILIVMMLATNNAEIKYFLSRLNPFKRREEAE
ncbi:MAG: branched-chain amino acid ABC transporter permease [Synergistaceae bacterium]|nr:branched-chain amino acid ABC transporter permease [Synergistaceae bacterium]MBR0094335.1 branched-chain amino acid ABC transporter permease [Synergistaceae bacterium]